jgi:hypothetical protein
MTSPPPTSPPPTSPPPPVPGLPLVHCPYCEQDVPTGEFCGNCGSQLSRDRGARQRRHAYAAMPNEQVLSLRVVTTLFPHLTARRAGPFRVAFATLLVLLVVLGGLRLTGPSILVASVGVPLLFLTYLWEAEVYEDSPIAVVGLTFGLGLLLGFGWAELTGDVVGRTLLETSLGVTRTDRILLAGVIVPLGAQLLMLAGTLVVRFTRFFDEALDGFAFGGAGALGFILALNVDQLWPELRLGVVADTRPVSRTVQEVLQRGIGVPVVAAAATGVLGAALWLRRGGRRDPARYAGLLITVFVVAAVDVGLGLLVVLEDRPEVILLGTAAAAAALLLWARLALHSMLMAEAARNVEIGPPGGCSHCHRLVPRMAFCPHCGVATRATIKAGAGRALRRVR